MKKDEGYTDKEIEQLFPQMTPIPHLSDEAFKRWELQEEERAINNYDLIHR